LDNALARGTAPVVRILAAATGLLVLGGGAVLWFGRIRVNGSKPNGVEGFWTSLLRTLDPGTMGSDIGWPFRLVSLAVTIGGIFIVSTLIGLLANGIDQRITLLRRGHSHVIESGHLLVLGWSPKLFTLLSELEVAREGSANLCVVVLAPRDKVVMEDEIRIRLPNLQRLRLVVRTGDPSDPHELEIGAPLTARSVVILTEDDSGDAVTVRTALALAAIGLSRDIPVITELSVHSRAAALRGASPLNLRPIVSQDWIARITAQVCRNPTLASVFQDLLDFAGNEVHLVKPPLWLLGQTVGDAVTAGDSAAVFGIRREGRIEIAPNSSTVIADGDELIAISRTVDSAQFSQNRAPVESDPHLFDQFGDTVEPNHIGIVGWSTLGSRLLEELDHYLPLGSRIDLLTDRRGERGGPSEAPFQRFELRHTNGDTTDPATLARFLSHSGLDRVVVLADRVGCTTGEADARVLLTLLELRKLAGSPSPVRVVAELLDPRDVELVRKGGTEEFIVGDRLTSLLMAQLAEEGSLRDVFAALLASKGPELAVIPAEAIAAVGHVTTYRQLLRHLLERRYFLIGTRLGPTVTLNPAAPEPLVLQSGVELIVIRHD
jgi:Trk K+ transport system NAD-binding subunit